MAEIVIMGAGLSGAIMAYEMKGQMRPEDRLTVVTKDPIYHFVPSNPWVPVGWRKREALEVDLAPTFAKRGIAFKASPVTKVSPKENTIETADGASIKYDYLIIATGPELAFDEVEGLGPHGAQRRLPARGAARPAGRGLSPVANDGVRIVPPSALLLALEARGLASPAALLAAAPFLATAPRGAPQAVIVLPGLGATDRSTAALRLYLRVLGYQVQGWNRGRNVRPAGADLPAVAAQISALRAATGTPVTLVGWSRGGLIAREAARVAPEAVRMAITLGSPFAAPSATNVATLWRRLTGDTFPVQTPEQRKALAAQLPVPCTSIYSRADGVVAWRACLQPHVPNSENVEVRGSHLGLGFNPAALWVIADRLAQPLGTWKPFRPSALAAPFFPRSQNAATSRRSPW